MGARAIIAGAGVGGVATALALAEGGFSVTIYERAPALEEFGAGLQLPPNATRILARLGLLPALKRVSTEPRAIIALRGSDDAILMRTPLEEVEVRWGAPYLVLHRADLLGTLVGAASEFASIDIRCNSPVTAVASGDAGATVHVKSSPPSEDRADLFVGADGLRSRVREYMTNREADALTFSGRVAFRATAAASKVDQRWLKPEVCLRLGPNAHLVHYPLRGGSVVNLVAVIEQPWRGRSEDAWDGEADRPALDRAFAKWSPSTRALLAAADQWRAWPLYVRPPLLAYAHGRVALVGDAAHPMVPFLAQGAAQAIEDANALALALARARPIPDALDAYSRGRVPRANRVQREAARQGRIYHMNGPMALARDTAMRLLGGARLGSRYDWLYGA